MKAILEPWGRGVWPPIYGKPDMGVLQGLAPLGYLATKDGWGSWWGGARMASPGTLYD